MADLFRDFWWLAFPAGWAMWSAWDGWLAAQARRDTLRVVEAYAASGKEPPAALAAALGRKCGEG